MPTNDDFSIDFTSRLLYLLNPLFDYRSSYLINIEIHDNNLFLFLKTIIASNHSKDNHIIEMHFSHFSQTTL